MNPLKRIYYGCTGILPLQFLIRISPADSVFPYHHIVSDEEVPHITHLYPYKNIGQFKDDLELLLKHFDPIHPSDLINFISQHNKLPEKKFVLTFDDGFKEVYEIVAPILNSKGIPAIFFINPAFIDNREMFYRNKISVLLGEIKKRQNETSALKQIAETLSVQVEEMTEIRKALFKINQSDKYKLDELADILDVSFENYLRERKPWLTTQQVKELSEQGFYIGAHSWNHPYYQSLSLEEQVKQTVDSCNYVEQFTNQKTFSFPHFDEGLSQELFDQLLQPQNGIDLLFGTQNQKNEIHNKVIHRFNCERPDVSINQQIKGMLTYSILQKFFNKQTVKRGYA